MQESARDSVNRDISFDDFQKEVLNDYRIACEKQTRQPVGSKRGPDRKKPNSEFLETEKNSPK